MWEMESTTTISTSLPARSMRVHFNFPSGDSERARRVNCASTFPSNFEGASLRAFSCNAKSRSPLQYLFLIRLTVNLLTLNVLAISLSGRSSSARSNILARVKFFAEAFPRRRYWLSPSRYSSLRPTKYDLFLETILIVVYVIKFKTFVLEY